MVETAFMAGSVSGFASSLKLYKAPGGGDGGPRVLKKGTVVARSAAGTRFFRGAD